MAKVFVSHATEDRSFVEDWILPALEEEGIETWYCKEDIKFADQWEKAIQQGLRGSDWVLVLISRHSVGSEWVHAEVHWGFERRGGKVLPVLLDESDPVDLHIKLGSIQFLDLRQPTVEACRKLAARIKGASGRGPSDTGADSSIAAGHSDAPGSSAMQHGVTGGTSARSATSAPRDDASAAPKTQQSRPAQDGADLRRNEVKRGCGFRLLPFILPPVFLGGAALFLVRMDWLDADYLRSLPPLFLILIVVSATIQLLRKK